MGMNQYARYASTPGNQYSQINSTHKGTTVASVGIANINWQASTAVENASHLVNLVKITFDAGTTPVGVLPGQYATFTGTTNITNKGTYRIIAVDSTTITINNKNRTSATGDETGSPGTVTIYNPTKVTIFDSASGKFFLEAINVCTSSPSNIFVQFYEEQTSPASSSMLAELLAPALTGIQGYSSMNLLSMLTVPAQKISGGKSLQSNIKITATAIVEVNYSVDFIAIASSYEIIT